MPPLWKVISSAFDTVSMEVDAYKDVWVCDETFTHALRSRYPELTTLCNFNSQALTRALSKKYGNTYECYRESNEWGVYSSTFRTKCPYDSSLTRVVRYYYRASNLIPPEQPIAPACCEDNIANTERARKDRERISAQERSSRGKDDVTQSIKKSIEEKNNSNNKCKPQKKVAIPSNSETTISHNHDTDGVGELPKPKTVTHNSSDDDNTLNIYWTSPEARKLFGVVDDGDIDVVDVLQERIQLLRKVNETEDGYQLAIPQTNDKNDGVTNHLY